MAAYADVWFGSRRGSLADMFDDYLRLLPDYSGAFGPQGERAGVDKRLMEVSRALYGLFPSYTDSPLPVRFDRIIPVVSLS
jgi:hypothetical protein